MWLQPRAAAHFFRRPFMALGVYSVVPTCMLLLLLLLLSIVAGMRRSTAFAIAAMVRVRGGDRKSVV